VPDPVLRGPTDAVVRITRACICGSDLWPYKSNEPSETDERIGHEFLGVVEETGSDVHTLSKGDLVVAPFVWAGNTCDFCAEGLQTSCRNAGAGTPVKLPNDVDDALLPSLLTLSDVFSTGHHAAVTAGVRKGESVAVVGDGAVGLCGVLAAQRLGAERIILLGRHTDRTDLGREFGATDVVAERGDEGVAKVMELTGGDGVHSVLECVGLEQALSGRIEPGPGFDRTVDLDGVPDGYRAMNDREALKVLLTP
jgi:threonine dehydrogenase-like Zn-dependent dehydrogenase